MPLLAYCIAEPGSNIEVPLRGVQGVPPSTIIESGLICFLSEYEPSGVNSTHVREAALAFNRVLQELLGQTAIVPFRFPTLLGDEAEIRTFLQHHAAHYRDLLGRLRDVVQIEINLTINKSSQPSGSGREYLLARQHLNRTLADAATLIRRYLGAQIRDWRQSQSSSATRCYMLVSRDDLKSTFEKFRELKIASELQARVTGPWPATDFIALPPDEHENSLQSSAPPVTTKPYA